MLFRSKKIREEADEIEAALDRGEAAPIGVVVDGSDSQVASVGSGYAAQIVARFNADRLAAQGVDLAAPGIDARVRTGPSAVEHVLDV